MDEEAGSNPRSGSAADAETLRITPSNLLNILGVAASGATHDLRQWQPPSVEDLQRLLPQYEVQAFVARGGMGAVYKGVHRSLRRTVAIKVLPPEMEDGDMQYAARFKHEAQAMARLSHPNIVAVHDAGEVELEKTRRGGEEETGRQKEGGTLLYFVMEFIEGTDVQQLIASEGRLDPQRAMSITTAVCEALAFAHEEGIIHRDIKPSNIMLDKKGRVKVADFGLAKAVNLENTLLTGTNMAMGTPDFIAPEALIGGSMRVDGRADIYAVGVMLYQMLTGKVPRGRFQLPSAVVQEIDPRLDAIVDKAMQTDRERRYSTASEMKTDVESVTRSAGTPVGSDQSGDRAAKSKQQRIMPIVAAAVVVAVAALAHMIFRDADAGQRSANSEEVRTPASAMERLDAASWKKLTPASMENLEPKSAFAMDGEVIDASRLTGTLVCATDPDHAVRVRVARVKNKPGFLQITLRDNLKDGIHCGMMANVSEKDCGKLARLDPPSGTDKEAKNRSVLGEFIAPPVGEVFDLEMAALGPNIFVRLNGKVVAEAIDKSSESRDGMFMFINSAFVRIERLEYALLGTPTSATNASSSPRNPPTEPAAIKLWDTADKIPNQSGARWENGALSLDGHAALQAKQVRSSDLVWRAKVLMNPNALNPMICVRLMRNGGLVSRFYQFGLQADQKAVILAAVEDSQSRELGKWPLSRPYKADEWLPLDLRIVGNELRPSVEGRVLGTVQDDSIPGPGEVQIFAKANSYFRDIEYVPLDRHEAAPPKVSATNDSIADKVDAIWKSRWSKPGRLRAAGTDTKGRPFDLKAAEPYDDFVQVVALRPDKAAGLMWAALRITGDVIASDGNVFDACIAIQRSEAGTLWRILPGGVPVLLTGPVTVSLAPIDFSASAPPFLPGSPATLITAHRSLDGLWHVESAGIEAGLMEKPDLTTPSQSHARGAWRCGSRGAQRGWQHKVLEYEGSAAPGRSPQGCESHRPIWR